MIYLIWNCLGLEIDTVVQALHGLIRKYKPSMIFLFEIKMMDHIIDGVKRWMSYNNGFNVPPIGAACSLSLW